MDNVWNEIPLEDYELHMLHKSVGQLQLLNNLTKKYLEQLKPEILMFLGIAGGNGLEHIDNKITKQVYGIDINQMYLNETEKRFRGQLPNLHLLNTDICSNNNEIITKANLIWAALIFEYVDIPKSIHFLENNLSEEGNVVITIQSNNGKTSVSETGVESLKLLSNNFHLVEKEHLIKQMISNNFILKEEEENNLPNGKSFLTLLFQRYSSS